MYFYNEEHECDFVEVRSGRVDSLVQVCWELDESNYEREFGGLLSASTATGCKDCSMITFDQEGDYEYNGITIRVKSVWK